MGSIVRWRLRFRWLCRRRFLRRVALLLRTISQDSIDQHSTMSIDQPLNLQMRLIVRVDMIQQLHIVNVFANLRVDLDVRSGPSVQTKGGVDVSFREGWKVWLGDFEPEQDFEDDGDVDDVSH